MNRLKFIAAGVLITVVLVAFIIPVKRTGILTNVNTETFFMPQDTVIPVKVVLEKTTFEEMSVLFIKDTAPTTEAVKDVLGKGYGELMQYIQGNKLQPRKFMAWYYAMQPPWPIDVAVETGKIPSQLSGRIQSRVLPGGDVLIAHTWGPYDQVGQAYLKIENWLKENNRKPKGNPFEVYLNDPAAVKSPSEIRTDVYQPLE
ncbi:MAG: GyrI-like domain-containing protein [Chitinophagaceae bacterium]